MTSSTPRTVALLSGAGIAIGAIGPWYTTFIVDVAGTEGDGKITLTLGVVAAVLVFTQRPPSKLLLVAAVLGILCAIVGIYDLIALNDSSDELFGQQVDLIDPGWGLWLTVIASISFTISSYMYRAEGPEPSLPQGE